MRKKGPHSEKPNRRQAVRFPMACKVSFKIRSGKRKPQLITGEMIEMSSTGFVLVADASLSSGTPLEVTIPWPVLLNNECLLNLVLQATVVRCDKGIIACKIEHREFRTRGRTGGLRCRA
jgi:hypothetical protein